MAGHTVGAQTYTVALDATAVMAGHTVGVQTYTGALDVAAVMAGHTVGAQTYTVAPDATAIMAGHAVGAQSYIITIDDAVFLTGIMVEDDVLEHPRSSACTVFGATELPCSGGTLAATAVFFGCADLTV